MKMKIKVVAAVATGSDQYLYFFLPFIDTFYVNSNFIFFLG
jgi:hypothetical protein